MRVKCKKCQTNAVVDGKDIPFSCPNCNHSSITLDYGDGVRPLVISAWFFNLEGSLRSKKKAKKGKKK